MNRLEITASKKSMINTLSSTGVKLWRTYLSINWVKKSIYNLNREISLEENKRNIFRKENKLFLPGGAIEGVL